MPNKEDRINGAIMWGATARFFGRPLTGNPYPDAPGWYVRRKAWTWGYQNAAAVLAEHDGEDPNDSIYDDVRGPARMRT